MVTQDLPLSRLASNSFSLGSKNSFAVWRKGCAQFVNGLERKFTFPKFILYGKYIRFLVYNQS